MPTSVVHFCTHVEQNTNLGKTWGHTGGLKNKHLKPNPTSLPSRITIVTVKSVLNWLLVLPVTYSYWLFNSLYSRIHRNRFQWSLLIWDHHKSRPHWFKSTNGILQTLTKGFLRMHSILTWWWAFRTNQNGLGESGIHTMLYRLGNLTLLPTNTALCFLLNMQLGGSCSGCFPKGKTNEMFYWHLNLYYFECKIDIKFKILEKQVKH